MTPDPKNAVRAGRYERIRAQLAEQLNEGAKATRDPIARMATIAALLHGKQSHFFWTGFYRREGDRLVVGPYQGPLACAVLPGFDGVCWAAVQRGESVIVADVHTFAGHVACDARSKSEIVVPVRDPAGEIVAVLDVDSDQPDVFDEVDRIGLESIVELISC